LIGLFVFSAVGFHASDVFIPQADAQGVFADRQAGMAGIKACRLCRPIGKNIVPPRSALFIPPLWLFKPRFPLVCVFKSVVVPVAE